MSSSTGRDHFWFSATLGGVAWVVAAALECFLFGRPSPYGSAYVVRWERFVFHALFFDLMGVAILCAPFLAFWLVRYEFPSAARRPRLVHGLQVALLAVHLVFEQGDHESMRFMGVHMTPSFLSTYVHRHIAGGTLSAALVADPGGSLLPIGLMALPVAFAIWGAWRLARDGGPRRSFALSRRAAAAVAFGPLALTLGVYTFSAGRHRIDHVSPPIVNVLRDLTVAEVHGAPAKVSRLVSRWHREWQAEDGTNGWRFYDPRHPLARRFVGAAPPGPARPPNVIYLQLESFRGWNVGHLRPDQPSATPTLDALARGPTGAYWSRFSSFGPPTNNGFYSSHVSLRPHSSPGIRAGYAALGSLSWTQVLRAHGWRAEVFSGCDPDWDGQRGWMGRWYDRTSFHPEDDEMDRAVFRRATKRILELGAADRPFVATLISITNHYPFTRAGATGATPRDRIWKTMRYTDDAIRDLLDAIRDQPWFARTIIVVTGDHGYNLGEHDHMPGQPNLYRESTWVPLVIVADDPRLRHGRHDEPASLLDVAPTLADLAGLRDPNPWEGHSLLGSAPERIVTGVRNGDVFAEGRTLSIVSDPVGGRTRAYAATDPLEHLDVVARFRREASRLERIARDRARLIDYLIESGRVWPETTSPAR